MFKYIYFMKKLFDPAGSVAVPPILDRAVNSLLRNKIYCLQSQMLCDCNLRILTTI